jgi:protein gp37
MGKETGISWTDSTFNVVWGCEKVSAGCRLCYAEGTAKFRGFDIWGKDKPRRVLSESYYGQLRKWNDAARAAGTFQLVFTSSMADIMEDHPTVREQFVRLVDQIDKCPWLIFQFLTKRPENYERFLPAHWNPMPWNVWLGTTVENADNIRRAQILTANVRPATIKFVSYEPALGPVDFRLYTRTTIPTPINWIIYGGESGANGKRVEDDDAWAVDAWAACEKYGAAFWYKQKSGPLSGMRPEILGRTVQVLPELPMPDWFPGGRQQFAMALGPRFVNCGNSVPAVPV